MDGLLTISKLKANSVDDKLMIFFLFSHKTEIVYGVNSHKCQILFSGKKKKKKKKKFQNVICLIFYRAC